MIMRLMSLPLSGGSATFAAGVYREKAVTSERAVLGRHTRAALLASRAGKSRIL